MALRKNLREFWNLLTEDPSAIKEWEPVIRYKQLLENGLNYFKALTARPFINHPDKSAMTTFINRKMTLEEFLFIEPTYWGNSIFSHDDTRMENAANSLRSANTKIEELKNQSSLADDEKHSKMLATLEQLCSLVEASFINYPTNISPANLHVLGNAYLEKARLNYLKGDFESTETDFRTASSIFAYLVKTDYMNKKSAVKSIKSRAASPIMQAAGSIDNQTNEPTFYDLRRLENPNEANDRADDIPVYTIVSSSSNSRRANPPQTKGNRHNRKGAVPLPSQNSITFPTYIIDVEVSERNDSEWNPIGYTPEAGYINVLEIAGNNGDNIGRLKERIEAALNIPERKYLVHSIRFHNNEVPNQDAPNANANYSINLKFKE